MGIVAVLEQIRITGQHRITLRHIETGEEQDFEFQNIIVSAGKSMIARRLVGDGNNCDITYGAVGTGTTAPDQGDTTLESELYRKQVSKRSQAGNQALYTVYFGPLEANGALIEYALFGENATETTDSGTMFNRAKINVTKTSSYTMTIDSTITIS